MRSRWVFVLLAVTACMPDDWGDAGATTPSFVASDSSGSASPSAPAPPPEARPSSLLHDDEDAALDPRGARRSPRSASLILAELEGLKSLRDASRRDMAKTADLLRRMGDDYAELAEGDGNPQLRDTARGAAIGCYRLLVQAPFVPPYARVDEARFYLALEEARAGDAEATRRAALDVLAHVHQGVLARGARFLLGAALAASPANRSLADETFERAARSSDARLAKLAWNRLGRTGDPDVSPAPAPTPTLAAAVAAPPPATSSAPSCNLDMECEGASVCRHGACVHL